MAHMKNADYFSPIACYLAGWRISVIVPILLKGLLIEESILLKSFVTSCPEKDET